MQYSRVFALIMTGMTLSACQIANVKGYPLHRAELVDVVTAPAGATASTMHGESCTTPCRLSLLSSRGGKITVEKAGYYTQQINIGSHVNDTAVALETASNALNAIEPDPVDMALDTLFYGIDPTGQVKRLDRNRVTLELEPLGAPADKLLEEPPAVDMAVQAETEKEPA